MSIEQRQRYERVKELSFEEQQADCPITINKGALLLDNITGHNVLQLKFSNTSDKTVNTIHIAIACMDEAGRPIQEVKYAYENLFAGRSAAFGSDRAVDLGSGAVQDVRVSVEQVLSAENVLWPLSAIALALAAAKRLWKQSLFLKITIAGIVTGIVRLLFNLFPMLGSRMLWYSLAESFSIVFIGAFLFFLAILLSKSKKERVQTVSLAVSIVLLLLELCLLVLFIRNNVIPDYGFIGGSFSRFAFFILALLGRIISCILFLLLPSKQKFRKSFEEKIQDGNLPIQIGLAVLTAFLIIHSY